MKTTIINNKTYSSKYTIISILHTAPAYNNNTNSHPICNIISIIIIHTVDMKLKIYLSIFRYTKVLSIRILFDASIIIIDATFKILKAPPEKILLSTINIDVLPQKHHFRNSIETYSNQQFKHSPSFSVNKW